MLQELFRIPFFGREIPIFGYGFMLVIGFLVAIEVAKFLARRRGLNPEYFVNAALLALVFGVLGARLSHVLENLDMYTRADRSVFENLFDAINISNGGLTFYGGLLLATPVCVWYAMSRGIPLRIGMDIVAICLMVGLGFGRIGCFFNGCCHGAECSLPWAVQFPYGSLPYQDQFHLGQVEPPRELLVETPGGAPGLRDKAQVAKDPELAAIAAQEHSLPVHPAQFYSSFNAFLIAATLFAFYTMMPIAGRVFALMLILKGITRFILEMLRTEPPVWGPLSFSMVVSIFLVTGGILLWFIAGKMGRPSEPEAAPAREQHHNAVRSAAAPSPG